MHLVFFPFAQEARSRAWEEDWFHAGFKVSHPEPTERYCHSLMEIPPMAKLFQRFPYTTFTGSQVLSVLSFSPVYNLVAIPARMLCYSLSIA